MKQSNKDMGKIIRGFTIVELLIVIVVIAILAAISVVAYNGIQHRAKVSAVASMLKNTEKAFKYSVMNKVLVRGG